MGKNASRTIDKCSPREKAALILFEELRKGFDSIEDQCEMICLKQYGMECIQERKRIVLKVRKQYAKMAAPIMMKLSDRFQIVHSVPVDDWAKGRIGE